MSITVYLSPSFKPDKKYMVQVDNKVIHFGAYGYEDYTIHKNYDRMLMYVNRHKKNENWSISGVKTAGFWSKHLLWSEPSLPRAINFIKDEFDIKIIKKGM